MQNTIRQRCLHDPSIAAGTSVSGDAPTRTPPSAIGQVNFRDESGVVQTSARVESSLCGRERRLERHPQLFIFRLLRHTVTQGRRPSVWRPCHSFLAFKIFHIVLMRSVAYSLPDGGESTFSGRPVSCFLERSGCRFLETRLFRFLAARRVRPRPPLHASFASPRQP